MVRAGAKSKGRADVPTAVPGDSWTQYSESGLERSLYQVRIASYLHSYQPNPIPNTCTCTSHSPWLDLIGLEVAQHAAVVVVPPHLDKRVVFMLQHWGMAYAWREQRPGLSRSVCRDGDCGQELVRLRV